jgi:prepilin-type N-terminal cleavage/methylation domain-containing protein
MADASADEMDETDKMSRAVKYHTIPGSANMHRIPGDRIEKHFVPAFRRSRPSAGFTLLEVIVATAIVALVFVSMMEIFSSGLRTDGLADEYATATQEATRVMNELYVNTRQDQPTVLEGHFEDGASWAAAADPFAPPDEPVDSTKNLALQRMLLRVEVRWTSHGIEKKLQLQTVKNVLKASSKS